jgi:hypothetical protein
MPQTPVREVLAALLPQIICELTLPIDTSQAAIVRGAALSGLHNLQPSSRRARRHYGFSWSVPFVRAQHSEQYRYLDTWDNSYRASGYMSWSLAKGDVVTEQTYISHSVCRTPREMGDSLKFAINVYCCDLDIAPTHRATQGIQSPSTVGSIDFICLPRLQHRPGVRRLATFGVDFSASDLAQCERKVINGCSHVKLDYELRVCFGSKRGVLNFLCVYKGNDIGRVSVTFDGQHADGADNDQVDTSCSVM